MRISLSVCTLAGIIGLSTCFSAFADEQDEPAAQDRPLAEVSAQRVKSLDRQARRAQSKALTATSYAMLEKYTLSKSTPQDWQSLLATGLADKWKVKGDSRRLDNQWIVGGKEESVVRFNVAERQVVILAGSVQCEKSADPFSQPRMTVWVRDRASGRVQQSSFSLPESSAEAAPQSVRILARYDMATGRMCTAQLAGENNRSAGNFSQSPGDIVAIGFSVPAGSKLKVQRLDMHRVASPAAVDSALQVK